MFTATGSLHTQGMGIDKIKMSVKISDQACALYMVVVSRQTPEAARELLQLLEIGTHCSRLTAKKVMVHVIIRPTIAQEMMVNIFVVKILEDGEPARVSNCTFIEEWYLR